MLCPKCFDIEERLFSSVQVVIRNPLIPYDSADAMVYTRPRPTSFKLSPLYAGKLMEVVSSAECREIPSLMFFRLRTGGWINASHVVCVVPAESLIQDLALIHLTAAREIQSQQYTSLRVPYDNLRSYIEESLRLIDDNPPYGIVMSALTVYPVLITAAVPPPPPPPAQHSGLTQLSASRGIASGLYGKNEEERSSVTSVLADNEETATATTVVGAALASHHGEHDVSRRTRSHENGIRSASSCSSRNNSNGSVKNNYSHHHHHRSLHAQTLGYGAPIRSRSSRSSKVDCRGNRGNESSTYRSSEDDDSAAVSHDGADDEEAEERERNEDNAGQDESVAAVSALTSEDIANDMIRFIYFTLHTVLYELECSLDESIPIADGTMLSLHVEIFAGCLLAAHDLSQQWQIILPEPFVPLVLRLLTMLGRISVLLHCVHPAVDAVRLREPAVVSRHVDIATERMRIRQLCRTMTDVAARLLLNGLGCKYAFTLRDLYPIREQLTYFPNEVLEKVFCELVSASTTKSAALLASNDARRASASSSTTTTEAAKTELRPCHSLDTDPLEIVVRLARSATLAESQIAAFRVVATIARYSPDDISRMATIVLSPLLQMAAVPRSPAVITASLECFFDMAYPVGILKLGERCDDNNNSNSSAIATTSQTAKIIERCHTYVDPMLPDASQIACSISHSMKAPSNSTTAFLTQSHRGNNHPPLAPVSFYPYSSSANAVDSSELHHQPCVFPSTSHALHRRQSSPRVARMQVEHVRCLPG